MVVPHEAIHGALSVHPHMELAFFWETLLYFFYAMQTRVTTYRRWTMKHLPIMEGRVATLCV